MSAGHFHIFWEYPNISTYWADVVREMRNITSLELDCDFRVTYLGNLPTRHKRGDTYLLQILLSDSKKAITRKWLSEEFLKTCVGLSR